MFSRDKSYDEPAWGTFDANDDIDSVWGFNAGGSPKVSRKLYFIIDNSMSTNASQCSLVYLYHQLFPP